VYAPTLNAGDQSVWSSAIIDFGSVLSVNSECSVWVTLLQCWLVFLCTGNPSEWHPRIQEKKEQEKLAPLSPVAPGNLTVHSNFASAFLPLPLRSVTLPHLLGVGIHSQTHHACGLCLWSFCPLQKHNRQMFRLKVAVLICSCTPPVTFIFSDVESKLLFLKNCIVRGCTDTCRVVSLTQGVKEKWHDGCKKCIMVNIQPVVLEWKKSALASLIHFSISPSPPQTPPLCCCQKCDEKSFD